jgi:Sensors of blue-light using FAD
MHSLVYVSSAVRLFSPEDLLDLLVGSRERNAKRGVTGMLLYKGGNVMQVLEGEDRTVRTLFNKITKDPRHCNLSVLIEEDRHERQFADHSMAFRNLDSPEAAGTPGYSHFLNEPPQQHTVFHRAHDGSEAAPDVQRNHVTIGLKPQNRKPEASCYESLHPPRQSPARAVSAGD